MDTHDGRPIAPVMSAAGADWLERDGRAAQEATRRMLRALPVDRGDTVVDVGCGTGWHARWLARKVGPAGAVYCVDLQPEMLERAADLARADGVWRNRHGLKRRPSRCSARPVSFCRSPTKS